MSWGAGPTAHVRDTAGRGSAGGRTGEGTMAGQDQIRHRRDDEDPAEAPEPGAPAPAAQAGDTEVDALLDEIDDVLETNAESFVRGFVQKGGQ